MPDPIAISTCPTCGRIFRPRVPAGPPELSPAERATLSEAQVIEYFKSTAPMKDVEFFLKRPLPPALKLAAEELLALLRRQNGAASVQTRREYGRLHQTWREWRNAETTPVTVIDPSELVVADDAARE